MNNEMQAPAHQPIWAVNCQQAMTYKNIRFNVKNIGVDIVKDLEITGEVGKRYIESKATYINTTADLNTMYLAFCKRLLGNEYEQRSVKTLGGVLKEVMEELFGLYEYNAIKVILSNDNVHKNRSKFEYVISKAIHKYTQILIERKKKAKLRAYKHYEWRVPEERAYPTDAFEERPHITDHALLPFMQHNTASRPEQDFAEYLEQNANGIEWWYKNGNSGKAHYAIGYTKSNGEKGLFYVDFIIRMKNGDVFLLDTKKGTIDPDIVEKHNALIEYINHPDNEAKQLHGGIIVQTKFGNWLYPPFQIKNVSELDNPVDWTLFDPQMHT